MVGGLLVLLAIGLGALIAWRITASITAPIRLATVTPETPSNTCPVGPASRM